MRVCGDDLFQVFCVKKSYIEKYYNIFRCRYTLSYDIAPALSSGQPEVLTLIPSAIRQNGFHWMDGYPTLVCGIGDFNSTVVGNIFSLSFKTIDL